MMPKNDEIWKRIPGFPGYEVSNHGRIRTYYIRGRDFDYSRVPKLRKRPKGRNGYRYIQLTKNKTRTTMTVASAVLLAFVGPKPDGMDACHSDGNKLNDHLSNLRYDTRQNNILDIPAEKRRQMVKVDRQFLSDHKVTAILKRLTTGESAARLSREYGVSETTISRWKNGNRRAHLLEASGVQLT